MIRKSFILFLIVFLNSGLLLCQTYFNQRLSFNNSNWNWGFNAIENDSGYIILGEKQQSGEFLYTGIMQVDFYGNEIFEKVYGDTTFFYFCGLQGSFRKVSSGGYIAYGTKQSVSRMYDLLYRFNEIGDTLWTKQLGDTTIDYNGLNVRETLDGGFICIGDRGVSFAPIFIIKTDSLGNKQWEKFYGGTQYDRPTSIAICSDGGYIYCTTTKSGGIGLPTYYNIRVMKVDSLGNMVFNKFYGDVKDDEALSIIQTQDGGYVVATSYSTATGLYYPSLLKLNSVGDSLWLRKVVPFTGNGSNSFQSVVELADGSLVAAGLNWFTDSVTIGHYVGLVAKITATGDLVWQKEHNLSTSNTADSYLYDIRTTSDGGFICSGVANTPQDMWLLKLDSLGCADTACALGTAIEEKIEKDFEAFKLYPNPANDKVTLDFSLTSTKEVNIDVFDVVGKKITQLVQQKLSEGNHKIVWDVSQMHSGIYFMSCRIGEENYLRKVVVQ